MFKTWAMIEVSLASLFFSCVSLFSYWVLQTGILTHSTLLRVIKKLIKKNIFILFILKMFIKTAQNIIYTGLFQMPGYLRIFQVFVQKIQPIPIVKFITVRWFQT